MSNDLNKTYRKPPMRTVFFAARKIHRTYFSKLSSRIPDSKVIYYKQCVLPALKSIPASKIKEIVQNLIQEKQNNPKRRNKSVTYWKLFSTFKHLEASWLYLVYSRELSTSNADKMVIWNGLKYRQLIAIAAARGLNIQCIFMENGLLPGYTTLDAKGINYVNSVPRAPSFFLNYKRTGPHSLIEAAPSQIYSGKPETLPNDYFFIPFQVNTDSQITRFSPWIKDMYDLVQMINQVSITMGKSSPELVFKLHPASDEDYSLLIKGIRNTKIHFLTDNKITTNELIHHAKAVITVNSTVGIEALLANRKVIVLGNAFYNIEGLTLKAVSDQELIEAIDTIDGWQLNKLLRENFFSYLAEEYQLPGRWQECSDEHLEITASRIQQVEAL
ncbi:MAG: hypothetical protein KBT66_15445 [Amphritea sp.]|nr:hypothetical protein [Amphritea sp.]